MERDLRSRLGLDAHQPIGRLPGIAKYDVACARLRTWGCFPEEWVDNLDSGCSEAVCRSVRRKDDGDSDGGSQTYDFHFSNLSQRVSAAAHWISALASSTPLTAGCVAQAAEVKRWCWCSGMAERNPFVCRALYDL